MNPRWGVLVLYQGGSEYERRSGETDFLRQN